MKESDLQSAIDLVAKRDLLAKAAGALGVLAGRAKLKDAEADIALQQSVHALKMAAPFLDAAAVKRLVDASLELAQGALQTSMAKLEEIGVET